MKQIVYKGFEIKVNRRDIDHYSCRAAGDNRIFLGEGTDSDVAMYRCKEQIDSFLTEQDHWTEHYNNCDVREPHKDAVDIFIDEVNNIDSDAPVNKITTDKGIMNINPRDFKGNSGE